MVIRIENANPVRIDNGDKSIVIQPGPLRDVTIPDDFYGETMRFTAQDDKPFKFYGFHDPEPEAEEDGPYRVCPSVDSPGCETCHHGKMYDVVHIDETGEEVAEGISYGDEEDAEHLARVMNRAYLEGKRAALRG